MKNLCILFLFTALPIFANAQSCEKASCGPAGTKKKEAVIISTLRKGLQAIVNRMSESSIGIDKQISGMKIEKGASDDESLLYISQAVTSIRYELLSKVESSKLIASLKEYKPVNFSTKQQLVSELKKEIQLLTRQVEKL